MTRRHRAALLALLALLAAGLLAPAAGEIQGAAAWVRVKNLLTSGSCATAGPCDLAVGTTIGGSPIGGGGGAPTTADYLVGTANGSLSAEIVVGTSPGGELGGTWASPTIDSDVVEELGQSAGETDLRYDATAEAYYYDVDGDGTRDADGTERFADTYVIEVPGDYASVQAALDSDDCKKGSNTLNQGCAIRVAPGTYAEKFEISDASVTANQQNSILIEGVAPMGWENSLSNPICAVTFTGDGTANHTVVDIEDAGGIIIRNFCIDMDTAAANDPKYGVAIGQSTASATVNKHIVVENITVFDPGASGGAAIRLGNGGGTNSDTAFVTLRNLFLSEVRTCIEVDAQQAVSNAIDNVQCSNPSATIGGISIGSSGGELKIKNFYMSTDAAISNQIGINVRNEAVGAIDINGCTFEWDGDDGTMINFENPGTNTGAFRASNISRCRFVIQDIPTTAHKCIDFNRKGVVNIEGNSFESTNASMTCEIDFNNPDAAKTATMNYRANDVQWNATQSLMTINETSTGGALVLNKQEFGTHSIGEDGTIVFEGATLDAFETTISPTNPTADRTVTLPDANSTTVQADAGAANNFMTAISSSGVISKAQPSFSNISGTATDAQVDGAGEEDEIDLTDLRDSGTNTCTGGQSVRRNAGDTAFECFTPSSSSVNSIEVIVDFGTAFSYDASTVVTGQTWVTATTEIVCAPTLVATADRVEGNDDALLEEINVAAHSRVVGTGFTVRAASRTGAFGKFAIHCVGV